MEKSCQLFNIKLPPLLELHLARWNITISGNQEARIKGFFLEFTMNPLMPGGNERPYVLKQTFSLQLQVSLSTYDLLLPPGIKRLTFKGCMYIYLSYFHCLQMFNTRSIIFTCLKLMFLWKLRNYKKNYNLFLMKT